MTNIKKFNLVSLRDETFTLTIASLKDSTGADINLEGHTLIFTLKDSNDSVLYTQIQSSPTLPFTFRAEVATVADWPEGNNKYILTRTAPDGEVKVLAYGSVTVKEIGE